ncbi:testis-expressed protein 36 [Melanotaenia boesemani]|uniref:testis-expressed protein 36 n=1 Tax=Melanotaenia boesemani TaxID=1250792 RepID=UPI001C0571A3|nr:testis-expressed protein 36 [Melanotaenia boesemani]
MVKGGKRHFSKSNDIKWFAHPVSPEIETRSRETCTSTGIMLSQAKSSLPQALNFERHPKWKAQQKSREYPFSCHDNKYAIIDDISIISHGLGRRKCPDELRQNNSLFSLSHIGAESNTIETRGNLSNYKTDYTVMEADNVPNRTRRFPNNHKLKSKEAALAQAGEQFMWFSRDNSNISEVAGPQHVSAFKASMTEHRGDSTQKGLQLRGKLNILA